MDRHSEPLEKWGAAKGWLAGGLVLFLLLSAVFFWSAYNATQPKEAPEAERVLRAQAGLPFQVLGPAANQQVYSTMKEAPASCPAPPAVDIPLNAEGTQEVTLVISPNGYTPAHFAVTKGVPVRLSFRQPGEVGCGSELLFQWGPGMNSQLTLADPGDKQVLEFTPTQAGDFPYHCPHLIYRGLMTVRV
jgi:hypothetical protein